MLPIFWIDIVVSYIPNLITVLRVVAAPLLILLLKYGNYELALLLFLIAGISDGLDGYIAKKFNVQSQFGAMLDPVADKILLVSCFVMLTLLGHLPFWLLVIVSFRDVLIVGGYLVLVMLKVTVQMAPSIVSKLNTVCQICLVGLVLAELAGWVALGSVVDLLVVVVAVTTLISGIHYVWIWGFGKDGIAKG
jgi:cardiolipin synthase